MAWNEPGSGKQRDPWKDSGGGGSGPDFDAWLNKLRDGFGRLFGGSGGGAGIAVLGMLLAWAAWDSVMRINADETGVVLRFGKVARLVQPGLGFKFPRPIETVVAVNTGKTLQTSDQVRMLTKDENIVLVDFYVQYRISDAQRFLFDVKDPNETLAQAAESAVRSVVGNNDMDAILSGQRNELVIKAREVLQATLEQYQTGLVLLDLNIQNVRPPTEVKDAFDDASRALQDKSRLEEDARAEASRIVPEARGVAAEIRARAEGDKAERIARAQGDAQRFNLVEAQYRAAPEITRKRLYLETMSEVLKPVAKVIDATGGKNLINLPSPMLPAVSAKALGTTTVTPEPGKAGN
ncbi:MAG: FtsH protease activity modulator HflK [Dokdonella sp.]|uniref:FtsH protease activity modulator HflK n=1 Tax=Dokdonella sp. TaxID=2291710 RepID=UPI0025B84B24|nr:FtsH protease activity modulator HflK [Dokdonella sp.]MBZ0222531.1 FtsH protease activity modulator HflK [Dokdonella sp.]MCC7256119.1 FtsH protease activity modulator HflK [Dokdonella sp.]